MEFTARVVREDESYWAEVVELPGCFASGDTLDELVEALEEAVAIYRGAASDPLSRDHRIALDGLRFAVA